MSRRLKIREICDSLGISKPTALKLLRQGKIPGGELLYVDGQGREHWVVDRAVFEPWAQNPVLFERQDGARCAVYFVQEEGRPDGPIKIGFTGDVVKRFAALQSSSPVKLTVLATAAGDTAKEAEFHERFKGSRLHGEWFSPTPGLLACIDLLRGT